MEFIPLVPRGIGRHVQPKNVVAVTANGMSACGELIYMRIAIGEGLFSLSPRFPKVWWEVFLVKGEKNKLMLRPSYIKRDTMISSYIPKKQKTLRINITVPIDFLTDEFVEKYIHQRIQERKKVGAFTRLSIPSRKSRCERMDNNALLIDFNIEDPEAGKYQQIIRGNFHE